MDLVESILDRNGPSLSSEVSSILIKDYGLNEDAARKRVSRTSNVRRLAGVTFPHKARFLYLQSQFGSDHYWANLSEALIRTRSAYGFAIAALHQRDGLVPLRLFPVVCGAPIRQSRHLSPDTILERMKAAGLFTEIDVSGIGPCIALVQGDGRYETFSDRTRARLITEDTLLLAVRDWLRNLGIASYDKVAMRQDAALPRVGTFAWDLSAPCYLNPLVRRGRDGELKNGFVACDVHLGEPITLAGAAPFIRKCATLRGLGNVGPCLQILVADRFDRDAFLELKRQGVIPATPSSLFGEEVADGLRQLASALESAARSFVYPGQFEELFRKLSRIEGAANQLRGALFEYLAAELARRSLSQRVWMNRKSRVAGEGEAEADLVIVRESLSITMVECKGYSPRATIPDDLFQRWLQRSVPLFYKEIKAHPDWRNLGVSFEFWTTAPLSEASMALFNEVRAAVKPSRYSLAVRLPDELRQMCVATGDPNLLTVFDNHFTKPEKDLTSLGVSLGSRLW